jgi:hypothetical protein
MTLPPEGDVSVTEFQLLGAPPLWVTVLLIIPAIVLLVAFVYRREPSSAGRRIKTALAGLRIVTIVILLLVLFQPVNRSQVFSVSRSILAFLIDESASMDRREEYGPELAEALDRAAGLEPDTDPSSLSRAELVQRVLANPATDVIGRLEEKVDLQYFGFAKSARPLVDPAAAQANGEATAIGEALLSVLNELRHQNLSGVVLVSDGQSNWGRSTAEVARFAVSEGIPVHTVGVGNPARPQNVAILEVSAPDVALVHDEVALEVTVLSEGFEGEPAELVIHERTSGEELASSSMTLSGDESQQTETIYFKPDREGEYVLEVSIPVKPGEQFSDDNVRVHHLRVEPEVIRVLYVEGRPRWEYRYLKNLLLRAENFKVQCLLTSASADFIQESTDGVPALTRFPPTRQDLFQYDVIILGDVAPDEIDYLGSRGSTEDLLRDIRDFVTIGGGFIMSAGQLHSPRDYRDTAIADILPVEIGNPEEAEAEKQDRGPFRPHLPDPLRPHDIVRLEKDLELNRQLLEDDTYGLAPMRWYAAVRRAKPGAEIILQHPTNGNRYGPHVLAAATRIPEGRTLFLGFDETWLWRRPYGDRYTERFWRAAVRHVAIGKLRRTDKRFDLRTDKERYNLGELVQISVRVLDENFRPAREESWPLRVQRPDGPYEDLLGYRQEDGLYERTVRADRPGTYRFWIEDSSQPDKRLSQRIVEVQVPRLEILNPSLDQPFLSNLAGTTGGMAVALHELGELAENVQGDSRRIPVRTEQQDLWDRWEVLALVMALLTCEWAVRKRFNLL